MDKQNTGLAEVKYKGPYYQALYDMSEKRLKCFKTTIQLLVSHVGDFCFMLYVLTGL